jgi:carboxymethylenebutenolidase
MMSDILPQGYLALPANGEKPARAILALHAWWGLNDFFKQFCDRLAQEGFVVFAPDMYEGRVATTIEQAEAYGSALDAKAVETIGWLLEVVPALRQHPRVEDAPIGVIGFSLGAFYTLQLLRLIPEQLGAVVVFYGTGVFEYDKTGPAFQGHYAADDEYEPQEAQDGLRDALEAAGIDATFYRYAGTGHWFFEADQPAYDAAAAELAWERTVTFLNEQLK